MRFDLTPAQRLQSILAFSGCPDDLDVVEVNGTRPADVPLAWKWYARSRIDPDVLVGSSLEVAQAVVHPLLTVTKHGRIVEVS